MCESSSDESSCVVLVGATLIDGTGQLPLSDSAILIERNMIKYVGVRSKLKIPEEATIIDLTGKTVTPGFIDSHLHYFIVSISVKTINLSDTKSLQETLDIVKERATKLEPGEWVHGILWDESKWPEKRYITTEDLDAVSPDNPVGLIRVDWHMVAYNTAAFKYMEKTGRHISSHGGGPSLNMMQNIFKFIDVTMPNTSIDEYAECLGNMAPYLFSHGCTGIHDPGLDSRVVKAYQMAREQGATLPRSYLMVMGDALESAYNSGEKGGPRDPFLTMGPAKFWIDG
jgi:predicted amidohydrolase YtcJ